MKEVGLNTSSQAQGAQRIAQAQSQRRGEVNSVAPTDSIESNLARTPDFAQVDQDTESRFDVIKTRLKNEVNQENYPPLRTIDALSRMLAGAPENADHID
ncbi:MAG: hypothetical protein QF685_00065 [Verrucomicrobiota bacterium]|jgi:hypothetical protein|nr:hypothetical protein [Verrucomicrobiota bacterium]